MNISSKQFCFNAKEGKLLTRNLKSFTSCLTHSAAPSPALKSGIKKRCSGSTLSKLRSLSRRVEGLSGIWVASLILLLTSFLTAGWIEASPSTNNLQRLKIRTEGNPSPLLSKYCDC
jgi:hypothetical protein